MTTCTRESKPGKTHTSRVSLGIRALVGGPASLPTWNFPRRKPVPGLCYTTLLADEEKAPGFRRSPGCSGGFSFPTSINISASACAKLLSASTLGMGAATFVFSTLMLSALTPKKVTLLTAFSPDRFPHLNGRHGSEELLIPHLHSTDQGSHALRESVFPQALT